MVVREATEDDFGPACAVLEAAFGRPDEARVFRTLSETDDLALALVAVGPVPDEFGRAAGFGATTESAAFSPSPDRQRGRPETVAGAPPPTIPRREKPTGSAADEATDGKVLGVAVLSHLVSPQRCVGLGPLAVAPEWSDRGIGKTLIAACIDRARRAGYGAVFVLGQPPYYTRFGFSVEAARPFRSEYPAEFLMALELTPGALAGGGELRYPPAFAGLGG